MAAALKDSLEDELGESSRREIGPGWVDEGPTNPSWTWFQEHLRNV